MKKILLYAELIFVLVLTGIALLLASQAKAAYLPGNELGLPTRNVIITETEQATTSTASPLTEKINIENNVNQTNSNSAPEENPNGLNFKAEVIEVMAQVKNVREDRSIFYQQNLRLKALTGERKGEEFIYEGISEIEVASSDLYKVGDKVYVDLFTEPSGLEVAYVVGPVRSGAIYLLLFIFTLAVVVVGRLKGLRALLSLVLSFFIILYFILPQILSGRDPFLITLVGGLLIMTIIIYLTEGWKRKSHLAILTVLLSLLLTLILSIIFTKLTRLTGLAQEEAVFLIGVGQAEINFRGLLLAGMIIGAIGVLDDIVVGQIESVARIKEANPKLPPKKVFSLAYKIGNTHLGAIINTLFLTYAGAALPLLLLFVLNREVGLSFERA
ncbi:MAG TPA: YibE/F family protein, partial [bacterium]|nr:YibE/F family protein [bacterium]